MHYHQSADKLTNPTNFPVSNYGRRHECIWGNGGKLAVPTILTYDIKWNGYSHAPANFTQSNCPGTHCTGGWVGLRASTRDLGKKQRFPLLEMQTGFFRRLFRSIVPVLPKLTHRCLNQTPL